MHGLASGTLPELSWSNGLLYIDVSSTIATKLSMWFLSRLSSELTNLLDNTRISMSANHPQPSTDGLIERFHNQLSANLIDGQKSFHCSFLVFKLLSRKILTVTQQDWLFGVTLSGPID